MSTPKPLHDTSADRSTKNVNLTEYKAWDNSALGVVERLLQEYARHLAIERSRGCEPFSGLPNPWSRFQQWYKVMAQPSYMESHYANKPWARTFLAELNRSKMLLRATTDRNGETRRVPFKDDLKEAFRGSDSSAITE